MTTVEITLPDQLAREARQAGLLSPEVMAELLQSRLRSQRAGLLLDAAKRMSFVDASEVLSAEAVAAEIAAMRAERRARGAR